MRWESGQIVPIEENEFRVGDGFMDFSPSLLRTAAREEEELEYQAGWWAL